MGEEVSLSAVGHALVALEAELVELEAESSRTHAKLRLCFQRMEACRNAISRLLLAANGAWPAPCPVREFPELSRKG